MKNILDHIESPEDIRKLNDNEIQILAKELREFLIDNVSKTGGHLASNLGVVELTLALHQVFNTQVDKIVWDVGHQSYVHKILTGRKDRFRTLRQFNGLSGFPKRNESIHDHFDTGHSSTSISAALGIATARDLKNEKYSVTAIIGDGALTGGMAFEALNHAGQSKTNMNIILNDNEMSISENTGGLSKYLSKVRTMPVYSRVKGDVEALINHIPALGKTMIRTAGKAKDSIKYFFVPGVLFEELGITYIGPVDGHNYHDTLEALKRAKGISGPVIIHLITKKGKGYSFAEERPEKFHGVSPFNKETGQPLEQSKKFSFSKVAGKSLTDLAYENHSITAITAAMPDGTGMNEFKDKYPDRFFDVGIAEQHAVTMAAGQAANGLNPVFAVYSTFLQRGFDQILHDVALQNLPVTFLLDRAGVVGADGETHQGIYDISYLSMIPNMQILSPMNGTELNAMIKYAIQEPGPVAIRYPKGDALECDFNSEKNIQTGKGEIINFEGNDVVIFAFGPLVNSGKRVLEKLKSYDIFGTLVNLRFAKPLDHQLILDLTAKADQVIVMEDHASIGGLGSLITHLLNDHDQLKRITTFALPDEFIQHGSVSEVYKTYEIDEYSIVQRILTLKDKKRSHLRRISK